MEKQSYLSKSRYLLLFLFALIVGSGSAWGDTLTEDFNSVTLSGTPVTTYYYSELSNGWKIAGGGYITAYDSFSNYTLGSTYKRGDSGNAIYANYGSSNSSYVIIPTKLTGDVTFYARRVSKNAASIYVYEAVESEKTYTTTGSALLSKTYSKLSSYETLPTTWEQLTVSLGDEGKMLAIQLVYTAIDDLSGEIFEEGGVKKPTNVAYSNLAYNGATISWNKGDEADTEWQVAYGAAGFDVASEGTKEVVNTTSYNITGLTEHTAYDVYVRTKNGDDYSGWTAKVNFTTPYQYPAPTALAASEETTTTATLSWTAGSTETAWELSYSVNSDFSESTEVDVTTSPTKGLTGLTANTTYYVKVRANYGGGNYSAWTEPITFKTLQVATSAANYSDDFESANNWTLINGTQTNAWAWGTAAKNGGSKGLYISNDGGTTNAYTNNSATITFASQLFSFAAGDYVVSYDWLCKGETGYSSHYDYLRVALVPAATELSAGTSTPSGFSSSALPTGWIALDGGSALLNVTTWQNKSVNINIPSNANYYVVFAWTNDSGSGTNPPAAIDNFAIRLNDTPNPANLSVTSITAHAGTLGWDSTDNTWEVYHSTSSTTPAANQEPTASPNTNSYTFTGLDADTKYYVWVRSVSKTNASWKSDWVGTNFTTDVAAVAPTGLAASSITATGATLSWTAGADETKWDIVYGTVNDATSPSNTSEEISTTPSKTLTGLTANTKYYFFVRAKKGEEVSSWVSTNFTTTFGVPFTEAFGTSKPTGWEIYSGLVDNVIAGTTTLTSGSGWNFGSSNGVLTTNHAYTNVYGTSCCRWLVTPNITLGVNQQLSFDLALTAYSGTAVAAATTGTDDKFTVLVSTDDGDSWTKLAQWDNAGSSRVYNNIATSGEEVGLSLSAYDNQSVKIAFYVESTTSNADNNLHIDNVSIDTAPACVKPTDLAASNATTTTVQLSWTSDGDRWDVRFSIAGEDSWTTVEGITTKPYTLTGLASGTTYEVQVRNVCSPTESSDWSNSATFTTVIVVDAEHPFAENFSGGSIPAGWYVNNENKTGGNGWTISSNQAYSGYYGDTYLVLPRIAVTEGMTLNFDQSYTYVSSYDKSSVVISTTGTAAANFADELWAETSPASGTVSLSLDAYAGQNVYIAFKYDGSNAHGWYVDNVMVGMSATANETASNTFTAGTYAAVNVTYTKAAGNWGTIALPFATTTTELGEKYGTTINAYAMSAYDEGTLTFTNVTDLEAGKPYVIYSPDAMSGAKTFYNKEIVAASSSIEGAVTFTATYAPMAAGSMEGKYGVTAAGKIMVGSASATLPALRGYLTTSAGARLSIVINDEATGIKTILAPADVFGNSSVYNLKGQKVQNAKKGLYIVNGKKVVIK